MPDKIELIARGFICRAEHVLLCMSVKHGYLYLPGGHVEFGESAADALAREFKEECGVQVRLGALCAASEGTFEQKGKRRHEVNLVFHVELIDALGEELPTIASLEHDIAFQWIALKDVPTRDVRPQATKALLMNEQRDTFSFHSDMRRTPR